MHVYFVSTHSEEGSALKITARYLQKNNAFWDHVSKSPEDF